MKQTNYRTEGLAVDLASRLKQLYDPFEFMKYCVFTRDEVDAKAPIKPAPVWSDQPYFKPYIEPIVRVLQSENLVIIDKARRMWISYCALIYLLHHTFTHTDQRIGVVSKKFEDADEHLSNMKRIYEAIPEEVWPQATRPRMKRTEGLISFEEIGSMIHALASGPDQARQYGFSKLFFDEFDFWEKQTETYGAALPTLQGGGGLIIATTHALQTSGEESFYRRLLEDRV